MYGLVYLEHRTRAQSYFNVLPTMGEAYLGTLLPPVQCQTGPEALIDEL
jgi:hypothetical protein